MQRHPLLADSTLVTVPTNTLKVGDLIVCHGGLFRVFRVWVSQSHDANGPGGECHANYCEFLGNAFDYECAIPEHWRDGRDPYGFWNEQGNGLARSTLVVGKPRHTGYRINAEQSGRPSYSVRPGERLPVNLIRSAVEVQPLRR